MRQIRLIIATLLVISPFAANADFIEITASSVDVRFTDFSVVYNDVSGDGLFQFDELISFSGFTISNISISVNGLYDVLIGTAQVPGISTFSGTPFNAAALGNWHFVRFDGTQGLCCAKRFWTYSASAVSVPEPGTLALLGIGQFGMGLARRRKRNT